MVGAVGVGEGRRRGAPYPVGPSPSTRPSAREPNPGTKMPYFQATQQDWWDEDAGSPTYNTHVRSTPTVVDHRESLRLGSGLRLRGQYRRQPAAHTWKGLRHLPARHRRQSHVKGCVAVGRNEMKSLLTWFDPAANPRITIGVGDPALLPDVVLRVRGFGSAPSAGIGWARDATRITTLSPEIPPFRPLSARWPVRRFCRPLSVRRRHGAEGLAADRLRGPPGAPASVESRRLRRSSALCTPQLRPGATFDFKPVAREYIDGVRSSALACGEHLSVRKAGLR